MLVEKEIVGPGTYWYRDQTTGLPRKLVVTPEHTKYWHEQGNKMLSCGLTVPVPCEHDFDAHPMSAADKLKNNAGWVKEYHIKNVTDAKTKKERKDVLFSVVDIQDDELAKKLPRTIRWTSPWINSFTDGKGQQWNNVITHLALTTRPRIVEQAPFSGIAAALSIATDTKVAEAGKDKGFCLSNAGRLVQTKKTKRWLPRFPLAFSLFAGGVPLAAGDLPPKLNDDLDDDDIPDEFEDDDDDFDVEGMTNPLADSTGDVKMEELLCDLLQALGVPVPDGENINEGEFKRHLYEAAMSKIKELTSKNNAAGAPDQQPKPGAPPTSQPNPLIQQEQQPMYMSLEEINKISDQSMKGVALAMYNENVKLRNEVEAGKKTADSLRDAKLREETAKRATRVMALSKLSPKVKTDLDAMVAMPAMALSLGDGGEVHDPMAQTLAVLEKGLSDMPRLLTTEAASLAVQPQPSDADMLTEAQEAELVDTFSRQMGVDKKAG